jgi:hypothetical protein
MTCLWPTFGPASRMDSACRCRYDIASAAMVPFASPELSKFGARLHAEAMLGCSLVERRTATLKARAENVDTSKLATWFLSRLLKKSRVWL